MKISSINLNELERGELLLGQRSSEQIKYEIWKPIEWVQPYFFTVLQLL